MINFWIIFCYLPRERRTREYQMLGPPSLDSSRAPFESKRLSTSQPLCAISEVVLPRKCYFITIYSIAFTTSSETYTNSFSQAEFAHEYPICIPINCPGVSEHAFIVKGRGCTVFECSKVQVYIWFLEQNKCKQLILMCNLYFWLKAEFN